MIKEQLSNSSLGIIITLERKACNNKTNTAEQ